MVNNSQLHAVNTINMCIYIYVLMIVISDGKTNHVLFQTTHGTINIPLNCTNH